MVQSAPASPPPHPRLRPWNVRFRGDQADLRLGAERDARKPRAGPAFWRHFVGRCLVGTRHPSAEWTKTPAGHPEQAAGGQPLGPEPVSQGL